MSPGILAGGSALAARYEELRTVALGATAGATSPVGLGVLRRQGVSGWLRSRSGGPAPEAPAPTRAGTSSGGSRTPEVAPSALAVLLAEMAVGCRERSAA